MENLKDNEEWYAWVHPAFYLNYFIFWWHLYEIYIISIQSRTMSKRYKLETKIKINIGKVVIVVYRISRLINCFFFYIPRREIASRSCDDDALWRLKKQRYFRRKSTRVNGALSSPILIACNKISIGKRCKCYVIDAIKIETE